MAGLLLQPLLLLLLSLALGSAGQEAQDTGERIINGVLCPRGSHPWLVALCNNSDLNCAGVLVNQQWVLTVAHCHMSEYVVHMGSDVLEGGHAQKIRATETFVHPLYENGTYYHDIMLVKLSSRAKLSLNVKTINLSSSCKDPGTSCTVSGWGITTADEGRNTTELMCSNVEVFPYQECKLYYPTMWKKYMTCAAAPDRLSSFCRGDSGSPLICQGSLHGLVSTGYFPCTPYAPVIYTRICMYRKWIYDTIQTYS